MIRSTLKYCKAIVCLTAIMLTSVCGYSQFHRHYHHIFLDPVVDYNLNAIARQAIFADLVLHDFSNETICTHHHSTFDRSAAAKLCAEEIAINTAAPLAYDLLSLTDINDRDLRAAGVVLGCAQLALSAAAIHKATQANKEVVEAEAETESPTPDNQKLQEQRRRENKAITTLFVIEAAAMTLDAIFGNYGGGYRPHHARHYYHHRHYYPYY